MGSIGREGKEKTKGSGISSCTKVKAEKRRQQDKNRKRRRDGMMRYSESVVLLFSVCHHVKV